MSTESICTIITIGLILIALSTINTWPDSYFDL